MNAALRRHEAVTSLKNLLLPSPPARLILMPDSGMKIFIDGKFCNERDAKISVFDHGLLYGDGIFEGIRIYNGRVFRLKEHIDRLFYSAKAILLALPMTRAQIMAAVLETCRRNRLREGYIRLLVTRGAASLARNPTPSTNPSPIIISNK